MAATALNTCTDMGSYGCRREALRCHLLGEATAIGNEQPHPLCSKNSDGDNDHPFTKIQVKFLFAPLFICKESDGDASVPFYFFFE